MPSDVAGLPVFNTSETFSYLLPGDVKRVTDLAVASIIKSPLPLKVSRPPRFLGPATVMAAHGPNGLKSFHVS